MKKTTLTFLGGLLTSFAFAQTYSTGTMELYNADDVVFTAKVDVTSSAVTLTLNGPDNRYLGFGFGGQTMGSGGDVVIFYDENPSEGDFILSDRKFLGTGAVPEIDTNQDWTLVSNTLENGQRTIVGTRVLDTGHDDDYVFSTSDSSLDFVWAIGHDYSIARHGYERGGSMESFTLSTEDVVLHEFKMTPNPAHSKFELQLPHAANNIKLQVFDVLGKAILTTALHTLSTTIDVSKWNSGVYMVKVSSDKGSQIKRFVKQ